MEGAGRPHQALRRGQRAAAAQPGGGAVAGGSGAAEELEHAGEGVARAGGRGGAGGGQQGVVAGRVRQRVEGQLRGRRGPVQPAQALPAEVRGPRRPPQAGLHARREAQRLVLRPVGEQRLLPERRGLRRRPAEQRRVLEVRPAVVAGDLGPQTRDLGLLETGNAG